MIPRAAHTPYFRISVWSSVILRCGAAPGGKFGLTDFANHSEPAFADSHTSTTRQPPSIGWPKWEMNPGARFSASPVAAIIPS